MRWFGKPGAASSEDAVPVEPRTPGRLIGTTGKDGRVMKEPTESVIDGVTMVRDFVIEWGPLDVRDPRLAGTATVALNADLHRESDAVDIVPQALAIRIENDGGSWSGHGTSISRGRGAVRSDEALNLDTIILYGAGAYAGLMAYLIIDGTHDPARWMAPWPLGRCRHSRNSPPRDSRRAPARRQRSDIAPHSQKSEAYRAKSPRATKSLTDAQS